MHFNIKKKCKSYVTEFHKYELMKQLWMSCVILDKGIRNVLVAYDIKFKLSSLKLFC